MGVVDDALVDLLYGEGVWFGLLLLLAIQLGIVAKWKLTGVLIIPISAYLTIEYLSRNLTWPATIMLCVMVFMFYIIAKELKGR